MSSGSSDGGSVSERKSGDVGKEVERVVKKLRVVLLMVGAARAQLEGIEELIDLESVRKASEGLEVGSSEKV